VFSNPFFRVRIPKIVIPIPRKPTSKNVYRPDSTGQLVAHGDYSSFADCSIKISAMFRRLFGIQNVYVLFTISRGTPAGKHCLKRLVSPVDKNPTFVFNIITINPVLLFVP
jgi:hypothetical protein